MARNLTPEDIIGFIKKLDTDALVVVAKQLAEIMEEKEKEALEEIQRAQERLNLIRGGEFQQN